MNRFERALQRRSEELGVNPPDIPVKKLGIQYPYWGDRVLYFFVHQGQLVYVGITQNLQKRLSQHRCHKRYKKLTERTGVYYSVLSCDMDELRSLERQLIQELRPKLNLKS